VLPARPRGRGGDPTPCSARSKTGEPPEPLDQLGAGPVVIIEV
jgi:hypothetical protein